MIVGVDPHKSSHTATALDPTTNSPVASLRVEASLAGYRRLMRWAQQAENRRWAVEGARGLGRHLDQWGSSLEASGLTTCRARRPLGFESSREAVAARPT